MKDVIKSLALTGFSLPATVSGWQVSQSGSVQNNDGTQTHSFEVINLKGGKLFVDLYTKGNEAAPHGWEATKGNTTNEAGYYSTGGLSIIDNELEDFDGVAFLPKCVCAILRALGFTVSDNCLASTLEGNPL